MGKTDETRKRIILSAIELAKEFGPEKISVKQIYEKAGISKNTFYIYFSNKEDVFGETYSTSDDLKMERLPQILLEYTSPLEQFWEITKIDLDRQMSFGPKLLSTIAIQNVLHDSFVIEAEDTLSPAIKISLSLIKRMQEMGEIQNMAEPFLLLRALYDCAIGIDIRWTKMDGSFDFKREMYNHMKLILQPKIEIKNY